MEDDKKMLVDGDTIEETENGSGTTTEQIDDSSNENPNIKSKSDGIPQPKINVGGGSVSGDEDANEEDDDEDDGDDDDEEEEEEEEEDLDYYYYSFAEEVNEDHSVNAEGQLNNNDDPEYFSYECLSPYEAEKFLQESVAVVTASVSVSCNDNISPTM